MATIILGAPSCAGTEPDRRLAERERRDVAGDYLRAPFAGADEEGATPDERVEDDVARTDARDPSEGTPELVRLLAGIAAGPGPTALTETRSTPVRVREPGSRPTRMNSV